jgi:translation initiation factor 2 subunit 2
MADEDIFDPSLKKKKKKKTPFDLVALGEIEKTNDAPVKIEEQSVAEQAAEEESVPKDLTLEDELLSLTKKKKKKKVFEMSELGSSLPVEEPAAGEDGEQLEPVAAVADQAAEAMDFSLMQKKKKKKKVTVDPQEDEKGEEVDGGSKVAGQSWEESDRDYTYDELLKRVFDTMRLKNPDMVAGEKKKFVMKPPQVMRVGTKKSSFSNFAEICKMLHRQPKHLLDFLLAELGTNGSIDGNNQLIIKGRFQQKQIESVLRRYIKEYVTCHTCRSPETILQKDTRLYFLQCETCGSRCSVASIKSGFQAVTGKRAAIRAKTT